MYDLIAPLTYMMSNNMFRRVNTFTWSCDYKRFKRGFEELLKHQFGSEIFTLVLASKKAPVRDPNAKYMR
jgi:hypothetical protein